MQIPFLLGLLAGTTYVIFDPLRVWFITNHISGTYSFVNIRQWISKKLYGYAGDGAFKSLLKYVVSQTEDVKWGQQFEVEGKLKSHLNEAPSNFILPLISPLIGSVMLLTGPKGSGKSELIHHAVDKFG
jgi:hypothetical protein